MKRNKPSQALVAASLFLISGSAFALTPVGDNFNTSSINPSRWSIRNVGGARLTAVSGLLHFIVNKRTDDDYSYLQLRNNQPGYNEDWEVVIDVKNLSNVGDNAGAGLWIYNAADPDDNLFLEFYGKGARGGFNMISVTNDRDNPSTDLRKNPGVSSGSMRISFDKATKQLTSWYDRNGSGDGYQWVKIGSFSTTGQGGDRRGNWNMNPGSGRFGIRIGAFSDATLIAKGKIHLDNFSLRARR